MKVKLKTEDSFPLVKLPSDVELLLFLIREDLKAHKLSLCLNAISSGDSPYLSDMSTLVLSAAGFADRPDELYTFYFALLDKYSAKLDDEDEMMKLVMRIYVELESSKFKLGRPDNFDF